MHEFFLNWLLLVGVFAVALASPGPDFVMAVRNSVMYSRRAGIMTAIGFGLGVAIHVAYCLGGLAIIIAKSIMLFTILKFIGAGYLFYVGYKALKSKGFLGEVDAENEHLVMSDYMALRSGFITNLFNPKATMFFLALFTQVMNPNVALPVQMIYGLTCMLMTMLWFSVVATVLTTPAIRKRFIRFSKWLDRACGGIFVALGIKLIATKV
ncbi:MAG: amino acid transporter [Micavibrio aeruginosavorus]|uniref:Amino acid transporter n=1 Tax=Micavibrio aeruginosavorus TaxID=349221 RepID=A0A2W5FKM0_9BACT|nr:MAG: amino acid transporter [Micavibrio aeruginosavorus]